MPPRKSAKRKASSELEGTLLIPRILEQLLTFIPEDTQGQQEQTTVATFERTHAEETFGPLFDGLECKSQSQLIVSEYTDRLQSILTLSTRPASRSTAVDGSSVVTSQS
jgi:hypothetical protein